MPKQRDAAGREDGRGSQAWPEGLESRQDIRAAGMRSVLEVPRWWWPAVGALTAIVVLGVVAWMVQLSLGLGAAGYNNQAFWAVYEADLVTFIGVSYGGAVVSAILRLTDANWRAPLTRISEATALVTLPIGMAFIIPHLGSPWKIWELVWPPYWNTASPILWDFLAVSTYLLATAVFFYLPLIPDLAVGRAWLDPARTGLHIRACRRLYQVVGGRWDGSPHQRQLLHRAIGLMALMVIPMAVSVHSVLSFAFASSSRAGYLETILPVYFVVGALYTGVALVVVAVAACRRLWHLEAFINQRHFVRLGFILVAFAAVYFYLTFTEYLIDGYSGTVGNAAWVRQVIIGQYWIPFWFYVVGAGLLPLLLLAIPRTRTMRGVVVASSLVLVAMWVKRLVIVIPPVAEPLVRSPLAAGGALTGGWGTYHFTWIPIAITVAATAAIPLALLLLFRIVPILPIVEMEELAAQTALSEVHAAPSLAPMPLDGAQVSASSASPATADPPGGGDLGPQRWSARRDIGGPPLGQRP